MNSDTLNICIQVFICIPAFSSLGFIPRSGIAESNGNSVPLSHCEFPPAGSESFNFSPACVILQVLFKIVAILLGEQ